MDRGFQGDATPPSRHWTSHRESRATPSAHRKARVDGPCPPWERHVRMRVLELYIYPMDVAVSVLRADLSSWIERARAGEEVVVTDRGTPVARLVPVDTAPLLDQLVQRGVLSRPPRAGRPTARGADRVHAQGPVAELVSDERR
ncbi:type II toxin-antitoxin system Phd/YefM family antitoxin [Modestobacter sp. DSM 44400]|uniref:type II toxin-antitoxin system Phd/YefM family antitoxin n=1 Tax=Modestobacter sp. DSM 44400 TaxID=1550230 RepID=UPI00352B8B8F